MSEEKTGLGTQFLREGDYDYDPIAFVATITPPQLNRDMVEVEDLNPDDEIKKKLPGLIDGGEMAITLNFDPEEETHQDLEDDLANGVEHNYRIMFPYDETTHEHGGYYDITGIVTSFAPQEIAASDIIQAEVTITVTVKPEYTEAEEL